jgi:hypothetical protein
MTKKRVFSLVLIFIIIGIAIGAYSVTREQPEAPQQLAQPIFQEYTDAQLEEIIARERFASANFGGKTFVSFKRIGEELQNLDHIIYMWVLAQEYYKANGELKEGSGTSMPIVMHISGSGTTKIVVPRDGADYSKDVRKLFPETKVDLDAIFDTKINSVIVGELTVQNMSKAQAYFK